MYEKAKEDHTLRTDIPFEEFMRQTVHVMWLSVPTMPTVLYGGQTGIKIILLN